MRLHLYTPKGLFQVNNAITFKLLIYWQPNSFLSLAIQKKITFRSSLVAHQVKDLAAAAWVPIAAQVWSLAQEFPRVVGIIKKKQKQKYIS